MTDTALTARGPVQTERPVNIDGEPSLVMDWQALERDRFAPGEGTMHRPRRARPDRCGPCTTLNRNIGEPSAGTPEAEQ